jgi:hypothetical protein
MSRSASRAFLALEMMVLLDITFDGEWQGLESLYTTGPDSTWKFSNLKPVVDLLS